MPDTDEGAPQAPTAFVSYSWDSDEHRAWVRDLATRLRGDGVDVILDQWHAAPGDQLPQFMERAVRDNDFVLAICTPNYKTKSDARKGGVGYEGDVMTAEVFASQEHRKFIPIQREGDWADAAPSWLLGKYHIRLAGDPYPEAGYDDLLATLLGRREAAPPVGTGGKASRSGSASTVTLIDAIDRTRPNVPALVRSFAKGIVEGIVAAAPGYAAIPEGAFLDDCLLEALARTVPFVADFLTVATAAAEHGSLDAAIGLYRGLGLIVERYRDRPLESGFVTEYDTDYYSFIGHELMVCLTALLMRDRRWTILTEILDTEIRVPNARGGLIRFEDICLGVNLLRFRAQRTMATHRASMHGQILSRRYSDRRLAVLLPMSEFREGDFFLFLRSWLELSNQDTRADWVPWSVTAQGYERPAFLAGIEKARVANELAAPLGCGTAETLRERWANNPPRVKTAFEGESAFIRADPLEGLRPKDIGSQP